MGGDPWQQQATRSVVSTANFTPEEKPLRTLPWARKAEEQEDRGG